MSALEDKVTVTTQHCPAAAFLPEQVREIIRKQAGVNDVQVELMHDPPWTKKVCRTMQKKI